MKLYLYTKWLDTPASQHRSYKAIGRCFMSAKSHYKALNAIREIDKEILVVCKHDGFEDAASGTKEQLRQFIINCWNDYR